MAARTKARKRAVDLLYEADLRGVDAVTLLADRVGDPQLPPVRDYTVTLVEGVTAHREEIDSVLEQHSRGWTVARMPAVDRAVLRLALHELLFTDDVDDAVVIDEAVELAKQLSTDDSPRFVNGLLARVAGLRAERGAPGADPVGPADPEPVGPTDAEPVAPTDAEPVEPRNTEPAGVEPIDAEPVDVQPVDVQPRATT